MTQSVPVVTVLIPVYRGAAFVHETLDAVIGQTCRDLAVLVSVDPSPDDSLAICREYEARDPRVRVVDQPERLGWVGNTNWLILQVQTPYYCIMPHDDIPAPTYVATLLDELERHPAAVVACALKRRFGDVSPGRVEPLREAHSGPVGARVAAFLRADRDAPSFRGLVARHRLPADILLPAGRPPEDVTWGLLLLCHGDILVVPEVLYAKRYHAESVTRSREGSARGPRAAGARGEARPYTRGWTAHCSHTLEIALAAVSTQPDREAVVRASVDRLLQTSVTFRPNEWARRLTFGEQRRMVSALCDGAALSPDLSRVAQRHARWRMLRHAPVATLRRFGDRLRPRRRS